MTKEQNPKYILNKRKNKNIATRCRVCGGQLMTAQDIAKEIHQECDVDKNKMYMM